MVLSILASVTLAWYIPMASTLVHDWTHSKPESLYFGSEYHKIYYNDSNENLCFDIREKMVNIKSIGHKSQGVTG